MIIVTAISEVVVSSHCKITFMQTSICVCVSPLQAINYYLHEIKLDLPGKQVMLLFGFYMQHLPSAIVKKCIMNYCQGRLK